MENENELNPLDAFADEEISEVSTKRFEQVPNNTFKRDGILTERIVVNGKRTNVVVIQDLENGGVWTASPTYRVVPHSRLLKTVNTLADEIGIELEMQSQPAMTRRAGYKTNEFGATIANNGRYMLASYTANRTVEVSAGDEVTAGITIVNTMDRSTALHIVPFVLRMNCMNQFHGFMTSVKGWQGAYNNKEFTNIFEKAKQAYSHSIKLQNTYPEMEMFLEALVKRHRHTKSLNEEMIAEKMAIQLELAVGYANDFKDLAQTPLMMEIAQKIVDAMPISVNKELHCINYERVGKKGEKKYNQISLKGSLTEYDLFNDYTNILTHNADVASNSLTSQLNRHKVLARLFNFGNRRQQEVIAQ